MADSLTKTVADSLKSIFTNINTDRLTEIIIAIILCFIGFLFARVVSNTFIRTIGAKFNAHQRLVWRRGIFLLYFSYLRDGQFKRSGL